MDRNDDKSAFVKKMEAQAEQFAADLKKARAKGREMTADAQMEWEKQINDLQQGVDDVGKRLSSVAKAGEKAWKDAAQDVEEAFDGLQKQWSETRNRL